METTRLDIGQVIVASFRNVALWFPKFAILLTIYTFVGAAIDTYGQGANYSVNNILGLFVELVATHAALQARYMDFDGAWHVGSAIGASILSGIAIMFGFILLIIPGVMMYVRWTLILPVVMRENPGASASMSRSSTLTLGNRWPILGLSLLLILPAIGSALAISYLAEIFAVGSSLTFGVNAIVNVTAGSFIIFGAVCWTEVYAALTGVTEFGDDLAEVFA